MLGDGVPLPAVVRQLRRADSRITARVYEHLQPLDDGVLDVALDVFARIDRKSHSGQSSCASGTPSERP